MADAITRLFQIIEFLANSDDWVSLRTIARDLNINTASVFRTLNTLKELGYVRQHPQDSKYQLTLKIAGISAMVLENVQLRQIAHPFLEQLTTITNETTHLAVIDGNEFIYIDKVDNTQAMRMRSRVGQRGLLHSTAVGKSFLAHCPKTELSQILDNIKFQALTKNTIIDKEKFQEHLIQIKQHGYAIDDEENEIGIRCIGAPIYDHAGRLAGALSISGWTISMTLERIPQLAQELISTCQKISNELGFSRGKKSLGADEANN